MRVITIFWVKNNLNSMIIKDNTIQEVLIEEPGEYKQTSAENLLTKI